MKNYSETLLRRVWSRVFSVSERRAVVLKGNSSAQTGVPGFPRISEDNLVQIDWRGYGAGVAAIMSFLRKQGFKKGDRAAILGWNCPEWVWADLAIQSLGGVTIPIYPNSSPEQVNYLLQDSGAKFLFSNENEQLKKCTAARPVHFNEIPSVMDPSLGRSYRNFVDFFVNEYNPGALDGGREALKWQGVMEELAFVKTELAKTDGDFLGNADEDLATIIYTSGSTGAPKGGCLTHGNISAACAAMVKHGFKQDVAKDRYLSYLPMAHVYERCDGIYMALWEGVEVAFCRVDEVGEALKLYRPSIMLGVPAVWRKMKDKITGKLDAATGIKKWLIGWALTATKPGLKRWLADLLVFGKIRSELGGQLRIMLSGGAPISPDVIQFFELVGLELLQGYGLTETSGGISAERPTGTPGAEGKCRRVGSVGQVVDGSTIKLVDDEIWIHGPLVFQGYWKMPEESAKSLTADGWFRTGDLGRFDDDGFLYITGRKKRLLKTEGGKYVAPEKIEKIFETEPIVHYVVPVGDGQKFISALIFVNLLVAKDKVPGTASAGEDVAAWLAKQPALVEMVKNAVASVNGRLEQWETIKKYEVLPVEASVANGLLTPTLKIRTEEVLKRYKATIDAFYAAPPKDKGGSTKEKGSK